MVFHIKIVSLKQAKRNAEPCVLPQFVYEEKAVSLILGTLLRFCQRLCQGQQVPTSPSAAGGAAGVTGFAVMLEPLSVENSADAENHSESVPVTTLHCITDGCDAPTGDHCWDVTAGSSCGMVTTTCAGLPGSRTGMTVCPLLCRYRRTWPVGHSSR